MLNSINRVVRVSAGAIGGSILGIVVGMVCGFGLNILAMIVLFLLVIADMPGAKWALDQLSEPTSLTIVLRIGGLLGAAIGLGRGIVRFGHRSGEKPAPLA